MPITKKVTVFIRSKRLSILIEIYNTTLHNFDTLLRPTHLNVTLVSSVLTSPLARDIEDRRKRERVRLTDLHYRPLRLPIFVPRSFQSKLVRKSCASCRDEVWVLNIQRKISHETAVRSRGADEREKGYVPRVMKNWDPFVLGPEFAICGFQKRSPRNEFLLLSPGCRFRTHS